MITPAIAFVAGGIVASTDVLGWLDPTIGSESVPWVAEATLTVVLFSDASRIDLRPLRPEYVVPLRRGLESYLDCRSKLPCGFETDENAASTVKCISGSSFSVSSSRTTRRFGSSGPGRVSARAFGFAARPRSLLEAQALRNRNGTTVRVAQ